MDSYQEGPGAEAQGSFKTRLTQQLLVSNSAKELDFNRAARMLEDARDGESLVTLLLRLGIVSEKNMAEALAMTEGLRLVEQSEYRDCAVAETVLPPRFLKDQKVVPVSESPDTIELAVVDPSTSYPARAIALASQKKVNYCIGMWSEIQEAIEGLYERKIDGTVENRKDADPIAEYDVEQLRDMASEAPVINLVNQIIQRALNSRASDIHIEPFENILKIRFRIDGVLQEEPSPSLNVAAAVLSRIKIMADLDIAERRLPQDGRINLRMQGQEFDIRVSTVPTMFGESLVLRLLQRENVTLDFASLGMDEDCQRRIQHALDMPYGMIVVTGPTGSGKTTTLYTALSSLNTEERKIITVEDPVEYNLEGINQIQVNPAIGLDFAGALRSIVRQDPDVIMVGEMRDLETAKICIQSALTGHLVLSTLHTNDAAGSVTRLLEMGIDDYLLNSTLNLVVAQRLIRKICMACREPYLANEGQIVEFRLRELGGEAAPKLYRAAGCEQCSNTGYHGRFTIVELLSITERIRSMILRHPGAAEIERAAREEGMKTMFEDACIKALQGITTMEEVIRVTQEA
jgi:general secretion pathway protein E